jgi:hypothetical protein
MDTTDQLLEAVKDPDIDGEKFDEYIRRIRVLQQMQD